MVISVPATPTIGTELKVIEMLFGDVVNVHVSGAGIPPARVNSPAQLIGETIESESGIASAITIFSTVAPVAISTVSL